MDNSEPITEQERAEFLEMAFNEIPLFHTTDEVLLELERVQHHDSILRRICEDDILLGFLLMLAEGRPDEEQITEIVKKYYVRWGDN